MKFHVITLILTCTILLISAMKTHRKNFDKRKTKLKNEKHSKHTKRTLINTRHTVIPSYRHTDDINRLSPNRHDLNAIRRNVISKVSQNIRKDILRELFFHRNESMKRHLSPQSREKLWRLRVQKSFVTRLENFPANFRNKVIVTADHEDLMGHVMRDPRLSRKDFIESQPRAKLETLNGILDRAVAHIFNKVLEDDSSSKKEHTSSYKKNTNSVFAVPRYEPILKNNSFNTLQKKELMLKYTKEVKDIGDRLKHENSDKFVVDMATDPDNFFSKPEKVVNTSSISNTVAKNELEKSSNNTTNDKRASSPSNPLNDTLLRQIDEIDFAMPTNESDRVPKNLVSQNLMYAAFEPAEGEEPEPSYGARNYNAFSREDGAGMMSPNNPVRNNIGIEGNRGVPGLMEKDDETREMEKESEDEIRRKMSFFFGNKHHSLPTAFSNEDDDYGNKKSSEVDDNSSFQTEKRILSSPERDYGTIFVKEGSDAKEINLYNADVHLAITVHSSADRFNAMKAVATVLKELGGLNFKEKHGGLVTKSEFDGVMVEADEEEDTSNRVNHPPNERQIKLSTFRGFTNSHPSEEREPMMNPLHAKKMLMMHTANEPVDEEKDEDAMNYYQKNKMGAGGPASVEPTDAQEGAEEREKSLELEPAPAAKSFGKKKSSKSIAKAELANENRAKAELANENAVNDSLVNSEKQSVDTYSADQLNNELNIFPGENIKDAESAEFQHSTPAHKPAFLPELKTYNSSMHNKTGLFDSGEDLGESESKEPASDGTHSVGDAGQNDGSWLGKIPTNVSDVISDNIVEGEDGEKTSGDVSDGISKQDNWIGSFASHLNSHQSEKTKKLNSPSDKDVVDIINPETSLSSDNEVKTTKSPLVLPVIRKTASGGTLDEKFLPVISQSPIISKEVKTVPENKHSNSTVSQLRPEILAGGGDNAKIVHLIQGAINSATNKDLNKPKMTSTLKNAPVISKTPIVMPENHLVSIKNPVTINTQPLSVPSSQVMNKQVPAISSHPIIEQVKLVNKNPVSTSHSPPAVITIPVPIPVNSISKDNVDQNKTRLSVKIKLKPHGNSNKLFNNMKPHGNPNVHLMSSNMGKGNIKLLDVNENVFNIKPIGDSLGASGRSFPVLNSPAENSKALSTIHGKSVPTLLFSSGKGDIGDEHLVSLSGKESVAKDDVHHHLKMAPVLHKQTDANGLFRKAEPERGGKLVDVFHAKLPGTSENNQRLANLRENMRLMATGSKNVGLRNETGSSMDTHKRGSRQKQKDLLLQDYKAKFPDNSRKGMIKSGDVYFAKPIRKVIDEYSDIHGQTPADIAKMIASREKIIKTHASDGIQDELTHSGDNENDGDNAESDDGDNGVTLNDDPEDDIENFEIHKTSKAEFVKSKEEGGGNGGYFSKKHKHKPKEKENEEENGAQEIEEAENGNLLFYPSGTSSSKTLTGTIRNISSNLIADIFDGKQSANFSEDIKRFTEISLPQLFESLEMNDTTTADEKKLSANDTKTMVSANKTKSMNETSTVLPKNTTEATKKEADTTKNNERPTKFGPFEFPDNTFLAEQPDIQVVNVYDHHKKTPGVDNSLLTPHMQKVPPVAGSNDANSVIVFNTFLNSTDPNDPGGTYRKVDMSPKTLQKVSSSLGTNGLGMMVPMGMVSNDSGNVGGEAPSVPAVSDLPIDGNSNAEDASFESEGLENMLMQDTMEKEPSLDREINSDRLESHPIMHHQPKMHHPSPRMHQKPAVHHTEPKINPYKSNEINRAIARLEKFTGVDKDVFNDIVSIRNDPGVNINDGEHPDNYANTNDGKPFAHEVSFLPAKNEMKIPKDWFVGFTRKEIENMKSKTKNEDKHLKHMINKFVDDNSQHMTDDGDNSDLSNGDNSDLYDGDKTNDDDMNSAGNNDDKTDNGEENGKEDEEFSYMQDWDEGKPTYDGDKSMYDEENENKYNGDNKNIIRPEVYKTDQHNLELNALSTEDRKNLHKNIDTDIHNIMSVMGNIPTEHLGDRKSQTFNQSVIETPIADNLNDPNLSNDQKMYSLLDNLKETLSSSESEKEKKYPLVNNLHLSRTNDRDPFKFNPYPYIEAVSLQHTPQNKIGLKPYSLLTNFKQAHTAHKIGNENQQTRYDRDPFRFKPIQFITDPKHISGLTRLPGSNQIAWNNNPKLPTKLVLTKNVKAEESANLIPVTSHIRRAHHQKQLLNGEVLSANVEPPTSIRHHKKYPALAVVKQQEISQPSLVENESAKLQPSLKTKANDVIQSFAKNNQEVKTEVDNLAKVVNSLDAKSETPDSLRKYVNEISSVVKNLNQNRLSLFEEKDSETSESAIGRESPRKGEQRTNMGKFEKENDGKVPQIEIVFKKHSQGKRKQELPLNVDSNLYDDINAIKPFSHNIDQTLHKNIDVDLYNVNNVLKSIEEGKKAKEDAMRRQAKHYGAKDLARDEVGDRLDSLLEMLRQENTKDEPEKSKVVGIHDKLHDSHPESHPSFMKYLIRPKSADDSGNNDDVDYMKFEREQEMLNSLQHKYNEDAVKKLVKKPIVDNDFSKYDEYQDFTKTKPENYKENEPSPEYIMSDKDEFTNNFHMLGQDRYDEHFDKFKAFGKTENDDDSTENSIPDEITDTSLLMAPEAFKMTKGGKISAVDDGVLQGVKENHVASEQAGIGRTVIHKGPKSHRHNSKSKKSRTIY